MKKEEKRIIEAALFISARPMALQELRTLTGIGALGYLQKVINELQQEYEERNSAIEILGQIQSITTAIDYCVIHNNAIIGQICFNSTFERGNCAILYYSVVNIWEKDTSSHSINW